MSVTLAQPQISQGDSLEFTVILPGPGSDVAGDNLLLTLSGVGSGSQSFAIPADISGFTFSLLVPAAAPDGTLFITASIAAVNQTAQAAATVKDTTPPIFDSLGVYGAPFSMMIPTFQSGVILLGAGLTDTVVVTARDNHALHSVGWALGAPASLQDSILASGTFARVEAPIALPESLAGTSTSLTLVATDADGNKQSWDFFGASIVGFNQHPVGSAAILDTITDLAIDTARGLVYLAQPDSARIGVLSLSSMTYESPIAIPGHPISLDLTPSGDSLLVVVDSTTSLSVVSLVGTPQIVGTIPVHPDPLDASVALPYRVRVTGDGLAMVTIRSPKTGDGGDFVVQQITLATNSQVVPWDYYYHYDVAPPPSARSGDATVVLVPGTGGVYYNASTKTYGQSMGTWNPGRPFAFSVSNASSGDQLMGHTLYVGSGGGSSIGLDTLWGTVIDPKGTNAYVAESTCLSTGTMCADTAGGTLIQYQAGPWHIAGDIMFGDAGKAVNVSMLPHVATSMVIAPDAKTLLAIGTHTIAAVDLTTSSPPSGSVVRALDRAIGSRVGARRVGLRPLTGRPNPAVGSNGPTWDLPKALVVRPLRHRP